MNCNKCGNHLIPGDNFCKGCGSPIEQNNLNQNNGGAIPLMDNKFIKIIRRLLLMLINQCKGNNQ